MPGKNYRPYQQGSDGSRNNNDSGQGSSGGQGNRC